MNRKHLWCKVLQLTVGGRGLIVNTQTKPPATMQTTLQKIAESPAASYKYT